MQRVANLVEAVRLGDLEVARSLVEGVLLEEEPDLVARVQEVVVLCLKKAFILKNVPFSLVRCQSAPLHYAYTLLMSQMVDKNN